MNHRLWSYIVHIAYHLVCRLYCTNLIFSFAF